MWVRYANNHTHELLVLQAVELTVKSALIVNTLLFITAVARVETQKKGRGEENEEEERETKTNRRFEMECQSVVSLSVNVILRC